TLRHHIHIASRLEQVYEFVARQLFVVDDKCGDGHAGTAQLSQPKLDCRKCSDPGQSNEKCVELSVSVLSSLRLRTTNYELANLVLQSLVPSPMPVTLSLAGISSLSSSCPHRVQK